MTLYRAPPRPAFAGLAVLVHMNSKRVLSVRGNLISLLKSQKRKARLTLLRLVVGRPTPYIYWTLLCFAI